MELLPFRLLRNDPVLAEDGVQLHLLRHAACLRRLQQRFDMGTVLRPVFQGTPGRLLSPKAQAVHNPQEQLVLISGDEKAPQPAGEPPEILGTAWVRCV